MALNKRDLPKGAGCVRREITLPGPYDRRLSERMTRRGVGRSEAVRQYMDKADGSAAPVDRHKLRGRLNAILLNSQILRQLHLPEHREAVRAIVTAAKEMAEMLGD